MHTRLVVGGVGQFNLQLSIGCVANDLQMSCLHLVELPISKVSYKRKIGLHQTCPMKACP